ncbi:hypothetical protein JTE90_013396 [Oedothorax gibbosus]|uniref:SAM domain-containing protein n=1 Tax=Oedothorax gibbosus TaxID=931172 RepID=A0AAV6TWZ0_9ARAC|nr:hypothetical protein JTE90_013396 [Oedothorax gibbosus]
MADEETANLLRSWGLSQDVIDKFRENDIDCRALKELNEDDVSSFFSTLGQRLRFRSGLKSLHPVVQPVVLGIGPDTPDCILSDISLSSSDLGTTSCSSSANSLTYERVPLAQSTPSKQVTPSASSPLRSSPRIKARLFKNSLEQPKVKHARRITSENLKEILNERVGGKAILNYYIKFGKLNHLNQVNLAKFVIDVEWHSSSIGKIDTPRFLELRDAIKTLFPTEDPSLFFLPYRNLGNGKKINARGKLYDQYHELRKLLIQSVQIESNKTKRQALNFDTDEEKDNEITNVKFEWLTKSSQPLNQAERYWEETRSKRLKQLDGENSITKYLETFPVLNENCG